MRLHRHRLTTKNFYFRFWQCLEDALWKVAGLQRRKVYRIIDFLKIRFFVKHGWNVFSVQKLILQARPSPHSTICSFHFTPNCFEVSAVCCNRKKFRLRQIKSLWWWKICFRHRCHCGHWVDYPPFCKFLCRPPMYLTRSRRVIKCDVSGGSVWSQLFVENTACLPYFYCILSVSHKNGHADQNQRKFLHRTSSQK